jgi:hypothetical protein
LVPPVRRREVFASLEIEDQVVEELRRLLACLLRQSLERCLGSIADAMDCHGHHSAAMRYVRSPPSTFSEVTVIPTAEAGTRGLGRARITPLGWERRTGMRLRFVFRRGRPSLLVADDARVNARGLATSLTRRSSRVVSDQSRPPPNSVTASFRRAMTRTGNASPSAGS